MTDHTAYWNGAGAAKTFTHPLHAAWIRRADRILDYGCGYGRTVAELAGLGCTRVRGADPSAALIERGHRERPDLDLCVADSPDRLAAGSFDTVLLFAVLTCVPADTAQRDLVAGLATLLVPGGRLYVSDYVLQNDDRNRHRYDTWARDHDDPYGTFATTDGAVCRHHDIAHLRSLLTGAGLTPEEERPITVRTMNGHDARGTQLLYRLPGGKERRSRA
ncbi:class I SAM-dependent methyltransferase [Symbioplanes lichenis]|uniref:class I SAM-dependent methyltransferase n=1 Tax=Symbioplanes lichenis TaxID=1629072 RepID=UPI00273A48C2|nr:class I SAM-dependent methyltransferase [Actinoplanes lichenis]